MAVKVIRFSYSLVGNLTVANVAHIINDDNLKDVVANETVEDDMDYSISNDFIVMSSLINSIYIATIIFIIVAVVSSLVVFKL